MKKTLYNKLAISIIGCLFMVLGGLVSQGWALPTTLYDILRYAGTQNYKDTGAEAVKLTDTDGTNDDATAFLLLEIAGWKDTNAFGIYGYEYDSNGDISITDQLTVFDGQANPLTSATIAFNVNTGQAWLSTDPTNKKNIGTTFGFFIHDTSNSHYGTWYSHTTLNSDGYDHAMIFDASDDQVGELMGSDVVVAFEDMPNLGDESFDDAVVGITDVTPVPEPATILLFGTGLLGLAGLARKKMTKA